MNPKNPGTPYQHDRHDQHDQHDHGDTLERAVASVRNEPLDARVADEASRRAWDRLAAAAMASPAVPLADPLASPSESHRIRGCADFQALIPAYVDRDLIEARALLLEDHTRECVPCRKALKTARAGVTHAAGAEIVRQAPPRRVTRSAAVRWGAAAAVLVGAGLVGWLGWRGLGPAPAIGARVLQVDGALYRVSGAVHASLDAGGAIDAGQGIRTARGSSAVLRLADGSRVELRERSEIALARRGDGAVLDLARGSVIVEASKQGSGHLYVSTSDCLVSVTGTVFSVSHGTLGSRVTVLEGEVHVDQGARRSVLEPGDQVATQPGLQPVPPAEEIAWSRYVARYLPLLQELRALGRDLDRAAPPPDPRTSTRLLDLAPSGTVIYAALPNVSSRLGEAQRLLEERMQSSESLRRWWSETLGSPQVEPQVRELMARLREFGERIGDEIVVTVQADGSGSPDGFLLMTDVKDPASFRPFLEGELRRLAASQGEGPRFKFIEDERDLAALPAGTADGDGLLLWIRGHVLLASSSARAMLEVGGRGDAWVGSSFHARIADAYREGAGWLFCADAGRLLAGGTHSAGPMESMGILDLEHLVIAHKVTDGKEQQRAVLTFDQPRRGLASWLDAPSPMGGLEFVSPDAILAAAFVVKDPALLVQDVYTMLGGSNPDFASQLEAFESENGMSVLKDFAAPIGGEFVFALDGPVFPKPAWKLVLEVYDPAGMQRTLEWLVAKSAEIEGASGPGGLSISQEESRGRTWHTLRTPVTEVHYTFVDGYLVAAPVRALVERAIEGRASGVSLPASARFQALLPEGRDLHVSALGYENLTGILSVLSGGGTAGGPDSAGDEASHGTLAYAIAEPNRIVFASRSEGGLEEDITRLFGLRGLLHSQREVEESVEKDRESHAASPGH